MKTVLVKNIEPDILCIDIRMEYKVQSRGRFN